MDAPDAPDPAATAAAQSQMNKETAITQYGLNATNVKNPMGSTSYKQIGTWPDGTPHFEQETTRSPEEQKLADLQYAAYGKMGEAGNTLLDKIKGSISTPFTMDAARGKVISDMQAQFLDPEWNTKAEQLESQLQNKGIMPGSEAYNRAKQQFSDSRARAYDSMYLDAYTKGNDAALKERGLPLEELSALIRGPTGSTSAPAAPTPGVAPVDYTGLVEANFKNEMAGYQAQLGAIGAAAGAGFGGWAGGGFKMPSDRRLKTDIELIGFDPRGWGIYLFRYLWDHAQGERRTGYMADEVAIVRPDVVDRMPSGFLCIDYGALDHA
jgi:hypothetical protein